MDARRAWVCALLLLAACSKKPSADWVALQLAAPPPDMQLRLDAEFAGALELLGAQVTPTSGLKPGSRVELTLYWRKNAAVASGFRLFTHVLDGAGEPILNLDGVGALRQVSNGEPLMPPSLWEQGKVYVDTQAFWVPTSLLTDSIRLVCGVFKDHERLPVTRGRAQSERVEVARLSVRRGPAASVSGVPTLTVPMRQPESPLVIDGKLDDTGWFGAATTGRLVHAGTGEEQDLDDVTGSVKLVYDERALYLGFEVFDDDVRGGFDPALADPHLWLKDTVEVMVDPDGDGDNRDYYEIQVGPQNLVFDSQFDAYNLPRAEPNGPFGHQEWSAHLESAVVLNGTLDDAVEDEGYVVELAVPWTSFSKAKRAPPGPHDTWRMNFYVMESDGGAAWSPLLGQGNFHKASRFGRVRFEGRP